MKRFSLLLTAIFAIVMSACSQKSNSQEAENATGDTKVLVAYFSASGVTEGVAKQLAEVAGADLFKIEPEQPYTSEDLDWTNDKSRSSIEMKETPEFRPAIKSKVENMDKYDTVYVGFPVWWYTCPTIINTFMESYNFEGKTVIPFATSGGSTIEKSCADLAKAYPDVNWGEGRLLNNASEADLKAWLKK